MTGLLTALAGSLAIGAWVAACCTTIIWLNGQRVALRSFLQGTVLAGLSVLLLAELVTVAA